MYKLLFMFFVLVLIFPSQGYANGPGTAGPTFLKIGIGARASAMGDAFSAIADDASALYWNPAGLAQLKKGEIFSMYNLWMQEIRQGYLCLTLPSSTFEISAIGINYVDMGRLEERSSRYGELTGYFGASSIYLSLGYARQIGHNLMFGIAPAIFRDTIREDTQYTIFGNAGLLWKPGKVLSLAVVVQNIGQGLSASPLPLTYKLGAGVRMGDVTVALDVAKPIDNKVYTCLGVEWNLTNFLALRAGYKTQSDIGDGMSFGGGIKFESAGRIYKLDYAYLSYGPLGDTHRFSLAYVF